MKQNTKEIEVNMGFTEPYTYSYRGATYQMYQPTESHRAKYSKMMFIHRAGKERPYIVHFGGKGKQYNKSRTEWVAMFKKLLSRVDDEGNPYFLNKEHWLFYYFRVLWPSRKYGTFHVTHGGKTYKILTRTVRLR